jgi:tetratricopeptide (TPR) repeat protein
MFRLFVVVSVLWAALTIGGIGYLYLTPPAAKRHYDLAQSLLLAGEYEAALKPYGRVLELDPNNYAALYNTGYALAALRRYGEALEHFERALGVKPDDAMALFQKANMLNKLDRAGEAIEVAALVGPDEAIYLKSQHNLACFYEKLGRLAVADSILNTVLRADTTYVLAYISLGRVLRARDDIDGALDAFGKAHGLDPADKWALYEFAKVNHQVGRRQEAVRLLKKYQAIAPVLAKKIQTDSTFKDLSQDELDAVFLRSAD